MIVRLFVFIVLLTGTAILPDVAHGQAVVNVRNEQGSTDYPGDKHSNGGVFYGVLGATNTPLEIGFRSTYDLDAAISLWVEAACTATFRTRYQFVKDGSTVGEYAIVIEESVPYGEVHRNLKFESSRPPSYLNNSNSVSLLEDRSVRYDFEDPQSFRALNEPHAVANWYW
ncbi:MAG: hypothetical protein U0892_11620 [Pirellulales bacterium]